MKPRKRFGQHFLHDPGILKRIVEAISPARDDAVVEIGPGEGALTRPLLERLERLTAIEIDRDLAAGLAAEFSAQRLTVVVADALDHDFSTLPPGARIVGNLPYNISTPILFRLARHADRVRDLHFMLQREVVDRMVAKPSTPDYGRLSVMLQVRFAMHKLFNVAPGAFRPPPKVESAVVRLVPLAEKIQCGEALFEKIVREAFSARRKTLRNALPLHPDDYVALGLDPKLRPENLSPADYVRITLKAAQTLGEGKAMKVHHTVFAAVAALCAFQAPAADKSDAVQGMSKARMARIAPVMQEQIQKNMFPGAVTLIARKGQVVHFEAHGFQDAAKSKPMAKDSLFRMASMTKPIVTVAAMMLVEEGRLKLNDPIASWLPELKDLKVETAAGDVAPARAPTLQDLMRHTAGFVYAGGTRSARIKDLYEKGNIEARETDITGDEMLKNLGQIPLAHQPGTTWEYSISTDVLGLLIERVTRKPLDALLKELLFDPLGMKETLFWVPGDKAGRVAESLDADPLKAAMVKSYRDSTNPAGRSYFKGGAGLIGTAQDYLKFCQMLVNGGEYRGKRYLSKKTVEFMLSNHQVGMAGSPAPTTGPGYAMGLGFGVRLDEGMGWAPGSKGDAMWAGAWGTSFWIDPKEGLVGILMAQGPSNRIHTRMLYKNLVYGAMVK